MSIIIDITEIEVSDTEDSISHPVYCSKEYFVLQYITLEAVFLYGKNGEDVIHWKRNVPVPWKGNGQAIMVD